MKKLILPELTAFQEGRMGAIVIADISGFTRFVQQVNNNFGVKVIGKLLRVLIESNQLGLSVSEIEGDAILFYRYGAGPTAIAIKAQFELMLMAFSDEIERIAATVPEASSLSVKMVVTYGELTSFSLAGFEKLYGEAVIKAHRLLKNHIDSQTYLLIEETLVSPQEAAGCQSPNALKKCQVYDLGLVCYRYIAYPTRHKQYNLYGRQLIPERSNTMATAH